MGDYLKGNTWSEVYQSILGVGGAGDHVGLTASEKDVWTDDGAGSKNLAAFQLSSDTLLMRSTNNLAFGDLGTYINQSGDGILNVSSDGSIVLDVATAINLDSDTGVWDFKDGGTSLLQITQTASNIIFQPQVLNKDIIFKEDGGTEIARFDSSAESLLIAGEKKIEFADTGGGEYISGNETDLTIASGGDIDLTATGDINIPSSVGVTFGSDTEKIEGDGTDLTIASSGDIDLTATGDINIPSSVGLTFGADNRKIEAGADDLTIASGGKINLTATSDVVIPAEVGLYFGANTEKIEVDGSNNIGAISSGSFDITAGDSSTIATSDGTLTIHADGADDKVHIKGDNAAGVAVEIAATHVDGDVKITAGGTSGIVDINAYDLDIDVGAGGVDILAGGDIDIDNSAGDINIDSQAGSVLIDGGETAVDAVKIYASGGTTSTLHLNSTGTGNSAIDIDSSGGVDIDSLIFDVNATKTVASAVSLNASGSSANTTLNLTSAGTGVSAIDINSSGGVDIDAANDINIDTTDASEGIKIGTVTSGVPIAIGHSTSEVTIGDNLNIVGDLKSSTDLTITSSGDIDLTATDDINIPSSVGLTFGSNNQKIEFDGTDLTITSSGDIDLTATNDINIPSSVGVTFGSDNQKIEGDGTDLNVAATGSIVLASSEATGDAIKLNASNAAGGIDIDAGTGGIDILSANQINIDTSDAGQDIKVDAQAGSVYVDGGESVAGAIFIYASGSHANTTLNLTSLGTGVSAIDINSSGGVDIDAVNDVNIDTTDASEGIKIGTVTSGVPIAIGHSTSEVSFGDNISVAGDCAVTGALSSGSYAPDVINLTHATDPILTIYNTEQLNGDTDRHGKLIYKGVKLDSTVHQLASIISQHDGSGNDYKGETIFYINDGADADDSLSEWLRGDSSLKATFAGDVSLAATKKLYLDGGTNTYIHESSSDDLTMVAGGNTAMILDADSYVSLSNNDSGTSNTLFGKDAGKNLDAGSNCNVFIGENCADATLDNATDNTGIGYKALSALTSGDSNTAVGRDAGEYVTTAGFNTMIGISAGNSLTSGESNTFVGSDSGIDCETGTKSTYIGMNTEVSADGVENETALGYGAVGQGANTIMLGDSNVTGLHCYDTNISSPSDERIKRDVVDADYGLNLINALRPITYKRVNPFDYDDDIKPRVYKEDGAERPEDNDTIYAGLIAQEVEEALENAGLDFNLVTTTPNGMKALGYGTLVMPLIKAVQELSARLEIVENK